jgi:hypothetical protein
MVFIEEFGSFLVLGIFIIAFYKALTDGTFGGAALIAGLFLLTTLWLFPASSNFVLLGLFLNIPFLIFFIILVVIGSVSLSYFFKQEIERGVLVGLVAVVVPLVLAVSFDTYRLTEIATVYQPTTITQLPVFDKDSIVHTTEKVALTAMQGGNNNSMFKPRAEHIDRTVDDKGVIYIAPNTPGTFASTYSSNPGFTILRDYKTDGEYVEEVDQEQQYGEGLFWTHGINHQLYRGTFFANYSKITPIPVNTENGAKVLMVADKIGYHWFTNVPKWLGAKISDGNTFEYLTPEQIQKDPRFTNRIIFPRELALRMVESQVANKGFLSAILPRVDSIDTDKIDDNLQEVLLTQEDGSKHPYYLITTQPKGGKALLSAYLIDGHNGDFSVYNFPRVPSQVGHEQAILNIEAGSSIQPWSSNYSVGMVQYYNGIQGPYWIGSIVKESGDPDSLAGTQQMFVENVAVSTQKTDQRIKFPTRQSLEEWMSTGQITSIDNSDLSQKLQDLRKQEDAILKQLIKV